MATATEIFRGNVLEIPLLAKAIGKEKVEERLPNGRVVKRFKWEGADIGKVAGKIAELMRNGSRFFPDVILVIPAVPAWLLTLLVHQRYPSIVMVDGPDGYVSIGCQRPRGRGEGMDFRTWYSGDGWHVVHFELSEAKPSAPGELCCIAPPVLPYADELGVKVVISGRGPNWFTASLAMTYCGGSLLFV